jgi:hypothetical protein
MSGVNVIEFLVVIESVSQCKSCFLIFLTSFDSFMM